VVGVGIVVNGTSYSVPINTYTLNGLTPGTVYNVELWLTGANGKSSFTTGSVTTATPVGPVTNLRATQSRIGTVVNVQWIGPAGATSYRIVVDGVLVVETTLLSYRFTGSPDTSYDVSVIPVDAAGIEGQSSGISVYVIDNTCGIPKQICP
jgi:hypothetical protein